MSMPARNHLTVVSQGDRVIALAPTDSVPQLVAAVVTAAEQWAQEADTMASLMGWAPSNSSGLGVATLRLLDAVHTLQERDVAPPDPAG